MHWTRALKYGLLRMLVPPAAFILRAYCATFRLHKHGDAKALEFLKEKRGLICVSLHCDLPVQAAIARAYRKDCTAITGLISASRDGQIFADFLRRLGIETVSGSSSKKGVQGMLGLMHALEAGHVVVIVVDGPRGPRGNVKPGALWLSKHSGVPIVALGSRVSPKIKLGTWDRAEIPLPFARWDLHVSDPIYPSDNDAKTCEELANKLFELKGER